MITIAYWAFFSAAVVGYISMFLSVLKGYKWGFLLGVAALTPYTGMWIVNYGDNRLIRTEMAVDTVVVSKVEVTDGRRVVLRLTPLAHTFYNEPNSFEFKTFGSVDDRPVTVLNIKSSRGLDWLITTVDVEIYVPNVGASSIRLDAISFGGRRYLVNKSGVQELGHHYAYE